MKKTVLIVDDEELLLLGWKYTLESAGYSVFTAMDGEEALKLAEKHRPQVVLTDLVMPAMNGVEVCTEIKKILPGTEVVLVSGHPDEIRKHQMEFINAGGRDIFLRKPLSKNEIIEAVEVIVKGTDL